MKKHTPEQDKLKNERINLGLKVLMALLFFVGAMVFSYPFIVDTINNFYDQRVIDNYQTQKNVTSDISDYLNRIDSLVYKLYGLNDADIKLITNTSEK